jgi:hypothetical protein
VACGACLARTRCGVTVAQAEAYATEGRKRHFYVRLLAGPVLLEGVKSLTSKEVSYMRLT